MRIELRDEQRRRMGRVRVDPMLRPTRVDVQTAATTEDQGPREVFLNWDSALDDSDQLRRCVVCGCPDLFHEKAFPQVTVLVVIMAFIGAIIGTFGLATELPVLIIMSGVLALDIAILVFAKRRLVCYQCRSSYHELKIANYHRDWDRAKAERYPAKTPS